MKARGGAADGAEVHRGDLDDLEGLRAGAAVCDGVIRTAFPIRAMAELIGRKLDLPTASRTAEEAAAHFGFLAMSLGLDAPATSALTRGRLAAWPSSSAS